MRTDAFDWLKASGWRIDETDLANLQIIDGDLHPDLVAHYNVTSYPTLILISRPLATSGYHGRTTFADLYKSLE